MMPFVKIHEQIVDSSIVEEEIHVRWLWIVVLVLCDATGHFRATPRSLARRANLTLEQVEDALRVLTEPDENSTSGVEEGRRLVEDSPNEWRVVNYLTYRQMRDPEERRRYMRDYMRKRRAEERESASVNSPVNSVSSGEHNAEAEAEAEAEAYPSHSSVDERKRAIPFDDFWKIYPRREARKRVETAWVNLTIAAQRAAMEALPRHVEYWRAEGRAKKFIPLATTWLNQERWNDEIEFGDDEDDDEWVVDTYRRADLEEHGDDDDWTSFIEFAMSFTSEHGPRTAPTFEAWRKGRENA